MVDWDSLKTTDVELINKIVNRAKKYLPNEDKVSLEMDVCAVHLRCPLKLKDLLWADKFNFMHDICGIIATLNRGTGKLSKNFLPRYTK